MWCYTTAHYLAANNDAFLPVTKKFPLTLFSLQDKTNNSLFGKEGKTVTHHWSNSITT
jgi:hypothetical protein